MYKEKEVASRRELIDRKWQNEQTVNVANYNAYQHQRLQRVQQIKSDTKQLRVRRLAALNGGDRIVKSLTPLSSSILNATPLITVPTPITDIIIHNNENDATTGAPAMSSTSPIASSSDTSSVPSLEAVPSLPNPLSSTQPLPLSSSSESPSLSVRPLPPQAKPKLSNVRPEPPSSSLSVASSSSSSITHGGLRSRRYHIASQQNGPGCEPIAKLPSINNADNGDDTNTLHPLPTQMPVVAAIKSATMTDSATT
jgi:hypothetical protein